MDGKIFILTGAGISAESGVPVFQGTTWRGHPHYELANIDCWHSDPGLVWEYYSKRRARAQGAKPNAAHFAVADLQRSLGPGGLFLCTQNVDGLHEAAGATGVVHIHGKLFESRCSGDCGEPPFADFDGYSASELPKCVCGAVLRPNVCWFGEQPYHLDLVIKELGSCTTFVAIGTSGSVQPVASFVALAKNKALPARTVYLGLQGPANQDWFDEVVLGPASDVVPKAISAFGDENRVS